MISVVNQHARILHVWLALFINMHVFYTYGYVVNQHARILHVWLWLALINMHVFYTYD